jgi:hypothetical protein
MAMGYGTSLEVGRRCKGCGEELRARVFAEGADEREAIWLANGFAKVAACPRCNGRALGLLFGAAAWDAVRVSAAVLLAAIVSTILLRLIVGSGTFAVITFALVVVAGMIAGVRTASRTIRATQREAASRVFWLFCEHCRVGVRDANELWTACEHCSKSVHEHCALDHVSTHAGTAYRG